MQAAGSWVATTLKLHNNINFIGFWSFTYNVSYLIFTVIFGFIVSFGFKYSTHKVLAALFIHLLLQSLDSPKDVHFRRRLLLSEDISDPGKL